MRPDETRALRSFLGERGSAQDPPARCDGGHFDLHGFTAFAETAEPEEVMGVLREYHTEMGRLILAWQGTLERFAGDGMMIFFNDPVPVPDASERAVRMAVAMRAGVNDLRAGWQKRGFELDFGVGIAQGYATIGAIGFEGRWDYGAIGTVTNLAARLCAEATPGQILVSTRVLADVAHVVETESIGELSLKGFSRPVQAFNVVRLRGETPNSVAGRVGAEGVQDGRPQAGGRRHAVALRRVHDHADPVPRGPGILPQAS